MSDYAQYVFSSQIYRYKIGFASVLSENYSFNMDYSSVSSEAIAAFLSHKNLTQSEFAEMVGVTQSTVSDWIKGKSQPKGKNKHKVQSVIFNTPSVSQNITGSHAHGTQIIGDSKTTNNYGETCKANNQVMQTSKLLETHEKAIDEIVKLTKIIASQQETIDKLISQNK